MTRASHCLLALRQRVNIRLNGGYSPVDAPVKGEEPLLPRQAKRTAKIVVTLTRQEASRKHIPTAELQVTCVANGRWLSLFVCYGLAIL